MKPKINGDAAAFVVGCGQEIGLPVRIVSRFLILIRVPYFSKRLLRIMGTLMGSCPVGTVPRGQDSSYRSSNRMGMHTAYTTYMLSFSNRPVSFVLEPTGLLSSISFPATSATQLPKFGIQGLLVCLPTLVLLKFSNIDRIWWGFDLLSNLGKILFFHGTRFIFLPIFTPKKIIGSNLVTEC